MKTTIDKKPPEKVKELLLDSAFNGDNATIKHLIETGAISIKDLNITNSYQQTPLYLAVKNNKLETVELLLGYEEVNKNVKECDGWTPLHKAAKEDYVEIVKLLLKYDVNYKIRNGKNLKAFDLGNSEVKQIISNYVIKKAADLENRVEVLENKVAEILSIIENLQLSNEVTDNLTNKTIFSPKLFK